MSIVAIILILLAAIPVYFVVASIPLWVAAKIAVSGNTTYGTALKVLICNFLAGLVIGFVGKLIAMMAGAAGGRGPNVIDTAVLLISIAVCIFITANSYDIGALHAFGVQLLSFVLTVVTLFVVFFGFVAVIGMANTTGPLRASLEKLAHARDSGSFSSFSSPPSSSDSSSPAISLPTFGSPSQPDYSAEIDGLLNAAMHPTGPKPSLSEREDIVRTLQQRLQAQRGNITAEDTRAINVYQNQLNRYLLLLNQVKAERKAHPSGEPNASPQATR